MVKIHNYAAAYATFLQSTSVPPSLQDDIYRLEQHMEQQEAINNQHQVLLLLLL